MFTTAATVHVAFATPSPREQAEYLARLLVADTARGLRAVCEADSEVVEKAAAQLVKHGGIETVIFHDDCPRWLAALLRAELEDAGEIILS